MLVHACVCDRHAQRSNIYFDGKLTDNWNCPQQRRSERFNGVPSTLTCSGPFCGACCSSVDAAQDKTTLKHQGAVCISSSDAKIHCMTLVQEFKNTLKTKDNWLLTRKVYLKVCIITFSYSLRSKKNLNLKAHGMLRALNIYQICWERAVCVYIRWNSKLQCEDEWTRWWW